MGWREANNGRIAKELRDISKSAYDYQVDNTVLGYLVSDFINLLNEAAKRLEETEKTKN